MKNRIAICFFIVFGCIINAQNKLSGTVGPYSAIGYSRYTDLRWEVSYKFEIRDKSIYLSYYNPKVTVLPNSFYATPEKKYSKSELGQSVWPESNPDPGSLNVSINCIMPDGKSEPSGFAVPSNNGNDGEFLAEDWVCAAKINGKELNLSAFKLIVTKASYNPGPIKVLDDIINKKKDKKITTTQNSNNPMAAKSQSVDTPTNSTENLSYNLKYSDVGISENTPTYNTKAEATTQIVSSAVGLASNVLDDWNANYDKKMARLKAESQAGISKSLHEAQSIFKEKYLPLRDKANAGDKNTQMILYFASRVYYSDGAVPNRDKWFNEALSRDDTDALAEKGVLECKEISNIGCKEGNIYLEKAAALGSDDAMVLLGIWNDYKSNKYGKYGEDPIQALNWFQKAADKGNPAAMYFLGMIYKYGKADNSSSSFMHIKYDIKPNEQVAFEWFQKALNSDNKVSLFSRSYIYHGSYFENKTFGFVKETFLELSKFYKRGKVVPKDSEMAKKLEKNYEEYVDKNGF